MIDDVCVKANHCVTLGKLVGIRWSAEGGGGGGGGLGGLSDVYL